MILRNLLIWTLCSCILLVSLSSGYSTFRHVLKQKGTHNRWRRQFKPENKALEVGKPPPPGMNGQPKVPGSNKLGGGGDAPADMEGEMTITDNQPTGHNTTEKGMPPKYPLNVESAEAQAHESAVAGCRDHPNAATICSKAKNPCFSEEHETYMYSFCRKSARFCDPESKTFHKFWRLRAGSSFSPDWMVREIQFMRERGTNISLSSDSNKAYASSEYSGYHASGAFDSDPKTMWMPDNWGSHPNNDDWIAYQFDIPVNIKAVKLVGDPQYPKSAPNKIYVEAADEMFGPFKTKWMIRNPDYKTDKIFYYIECKVLWRKLETGDTPICFRLIAKYKNWMEARDECRIEGGELASISDPEEARFIQEEIKPCGFAWIGLNDRQQEGNYRWIDMSNSTFTNWKEGWIYDEVQRHYEDCVAMGKEGNWFSMSCQNKFYFICRTPLVEPPPPAPEKPPAKEEPPIQFMAPNYTVPVVGNMPSTEESEEENENEEYSELLTDVALEEMKEKGLKPPDSISNIVVPPPNLGEQLSNLTKDALKHINKQEGNMSDAPQPNGTKAGPGVIVPAGAGKPVNKKKLKQPSTPTSPGQTPVQVIQGVKIPPQAKPPPPKEGPQDSNNEPSVGEAGDEGPAEREADMGANTRPESHKKSKKKKLKQQTPAEASNAPEYPDELKSPEEDSQEYQEPDLNSNAPLNGAGQPTSKGQGNVLLNSPSIANSQEQVDKNSEAEGSISEYTHSKNNHRVSSKQESEVDSAPTKKSASDKDDEFEINQAVENSESGSGSGSNGDELDIDEDLLDLAIDDLV